MSDPTIPPDPYGQEPTPPPNPYEPYGQPAYGYASPSYAFAGWGQRVGAYLVDTLVLFVGYVPVLLGALVGGGAGTFIQLIGVVTTIGVFVWNICLQGGNTGYTVGKAALAIKLVKPETGQPIGAGIAFLRALCHIVDSLPCYIGYLWPLWDAKKQTFADKIVGSVVINQPKG